MEFLRPLAMVVFAFVGVRAILRRRRDKREAPAREAEKARAPKRETLSDIRAFAEDRTLPFVGWRPEGVPPADPGASRLGGPVWRPKGIPWPTGKDGTPLAFLAQIALDRMPALPDWPTHGVLQFFIAQDDFFGADLDDPVSGSARVEWIEDVGGEGDWTPTEPVPGFDTPFADDSVRQSGRALVHTASQTMTPFRDSEAVRTRLAAFTGHESLERLENLFTVREGRDVPPIYSGGHPAFTQNDPRERELGAQDLVLLQLGSDDHLMWGDMGEAVFLIARDDLVARRFDRAVFWWDCH